MKDFKRNKGNFAKRRFGDQEKTFDEFRKDRPRSFSGRREGFGNRSGGRDGGRLEMHDAICARCGKETTIPFKPTHGKPVYCRDCFKIADKEPEERTVRSAGSSASPGIQEQIAQLNKKLDRIIKILTE